MSLFPENIPAPTGDVQADLATLYAYIDYLTRRLEWYLSTLPTGEQTNV